MISAKEMSDPEVQALTIMKYLAKFQKLTEENEKPHIRILDVSNVQANKPVSDKAGLTSLLVEFSVPSELIYLRHRFTGDVRNRRSESHSEH